MNNEIIENKYIHNKIKLKGISFARALSTIGIVFYHYFSKSRGSFKLLRKTANSNWGFIYVTTFFCISGTVLYYNYPKIHSLKQFYYKRWKSIFPPFYICYVYFFLRQTFISHQLFCKGHCSKLIYTILGIDGYLSYKIKTYYLVGEWFLGAIIILYILYPIIIILMDKNIILFSLFIIISNSLLYTENIFVINKFTNIITCVNSFYFGIVAIKFKKFFFENRITLSVFLIIFLLLYKIKIKENILIFLMQGYSFFIVLVQINEYIKSRTILSIFNKISTLSYSIYLFHHRIINDIQGINNPNEWYLHLLLLGAVIALTIIASSIHLMVVNSIMKSKIFKKLDTFF